MFPTEHVRGLSLACLENPGVQPVLADALDEAGKHDLAATARECRLSNALLQELTKSPDERHVEKFRDTVFVRSGVTGNRWTIAELQNRITRKRPRGSWSKVELAKRLQTMLDERAGRRWAIATKGQRKPTASQEAEFLARIEAGLDAVQSRARERRIDIDDVVRAAAGADWNGVASRDGGKVTCGSYGYSWETTTASATRLPNGTICVTLSRGTRRTEIVAPAKWWRTIAG